MSEKPFVPDCRAFTYLFRQAPGVIGYRRIDGKNISLELPHPKTGIMKVFPIPFDERDRRTIIIFDGDIPWQGISRSASHHLLEVFKDFTIRVDEMRKERDFEDSMPKCFEFDNLDEMGITLCRRLIVTPCGNLVLRRYEPSFLSRYAFVEVRRSKTGKHEVTWRNSSY